MNASKILIVEDEVLIAEHIKRYLISFGYSHIYLAHTKSLAYQALEHIHPDLVLLDIHLQGALDGIEIAKSIDQKNKIPYIFITANADLLIIQEAIHTKAIAYITKPFKKSDLFAAVQIALKALPFTEEPFLVIKENNSTIKVTINDIQFIESNGNYINFYTKTHKQIARRSLEWAEEQLPEQQFMRVHRSFIVNVRFISRKNANSIFIGEVEIPVSRTYLPRLLAYLK